MKKLYNILHTGALAVAMLLVPVSVLQAQNSKKKVPVVEVGAQVVDAAGNPVVGAIVQSNEGAIVRYTDAEGRFSIRSKANGAVLIEAFGYNDLLVPVMSNSLPKVLHMVSEGVFASERDVLERPDGGKTLQRDLTAAISRVSVEDLKKYPDLQLSNALQGRAPGLVAIAGDGALGYNASTLYVRGISTNGSGNAAVVIIDGIERPIDDIMPEEIESIEILKDAAAKILYGAQATNGVVLIKTRRGEAHKRLIRVGLEYGVQPSSRMPEFLGAYDYANLYNEARANDGMTPFYSAKQLNGYRNTTGANDVLYPDVDYYKEFIRKQTTYRKATVEFNGGSDRLRYSMTAGYMGGAGLEDVGKRSGLDRFSARGNLDIAITDFLSVSADVAGRIESRAWAAKDGQSIFTAMSTNRPNEYPLVIPYEFVKDDPSIAENTDGTPLFGASTNRPDNLYADMKYRGATEERYVNSQTNLGLNLDMNKYVKGLTAGVYLTFDNYSYLKHEQRSTYPTYAVETYLDDAGQDVVRVTQMKSLSKSVRQNVASNRTSSYLGWRGMVGYARTFGGVHDFSAVAAYRFMKEEVSGTTQDVKDQNVSLRLNYGFGKRYIVEATLAMMGSNKFMKSERNFLSSSVSAAWVISNEGFMNGAKGVDFLKLKAGFGRLGFAGNTGYLLYSTAWREDGTYSFIPTTSNRHTVLGRIGNTGLTWEYSDEFNVGLEGLFLGKRLSAEFDFFTEKRKDIIGLTTDRTANIVGEYLSYKNMGEVSNMGFEGAVKWSAKVNDDFSYSVGVNFSYSKNELEKWDELPQTESYRSEIGRPTSGIYGLESMGLFGRNVNLSNHPLQTFGNYRSGDIAYADLNGDGVVDDNDKKYLGQTFPLTSWGINIDLNYKGFGLYVLGTLHTGTTAMLTNSYYWNYGLDSYSELANDRYHAVNNPEGTMPRLTTTDGTNNFRNSNFWSENSSFFRLKNVELSYTFRNKTGEGVGKSYKLFVRGTNLWTVSAIKDVDPERINAGLTNYPAYTTITGGVSISF